MATTTNPNIIAKKANPAQPSRFSGIARSYGGPFLLYLGLTMIFSWPLLLHLGDSAIRVRSGDVWQNLWNLWWVRHALFDLHTNPFRTSLVYYPDSPGLYLHALYPLAGLLSSPLQWLFGLTASFNLLAILMLTLSAFCAYLLGRYLELSPGAALLVGTIFAYSPILSSQLDQGQLEQISPLWLPLYILFFLKAVRTPNFGRSFWLNSAGAGLCFLLTALTTWYYALNLILFSALAAVWFVLNNLFKRRKPTFTIARLAVIAGICLLFAAPLLYPTLKEAINSTYAEARRVSVLYNSADIVHFFKPGDSALWFSRAEPEYEFQWFLGFVTLALAGVGAVTAWRKTRFWLAMAVAFIVLAFGPALKIGLEDYTPIGHLPTEWLLDLPLGNIIRVPLRFATIAMLFLGIAAGFGLDNLSRKIVTLPKTANYKTFLPSLLAGLAILLVFLEFYPGPRTLVAIEAPNFMGQIKNGPEGAVMEVPMLKELSLASVAMYEQTQHGKPIVGGYLARKPKLDFMERTPVVNELMQMSDPSRYADLSTNRLDLFGLPVLNYYNIRYIILHRDLLTDDEKEKTYNLLRQVLGQNVQPSAKDGEAELYIVPQTSNPVNTAWVKADIGWYELEGNKGDYHRWSSGEGQYVLFNPNKQTEHYRLDLSLYSFAEDRVVEFWLNGQLIAKKNITPNVQPETLEFNLPSGPSTLLLKATGKPLRPKDRGGDPADTRLLSFGVRDLSIKVI
jgi:hypothetical protein